MKCFILMMFFAVNLTQSCETKMQLTYITNGDILMMRCEILDHSCCKHIKDLEFVKNGEGVCSVPNCDGHYDVPQTRHDTVFYKCGCTGLNMDDVFFTTINVRKSDYGEWFCRCNNMSDVIEDQSNVIVIQPDDSTFSTAAPLVVTDGTDQKVIIGAVSVVMFIVILYILVKATIFSCRKENRKRLRDLLRRSGQENSSEGEEEEMMEEIWPRYKQITGEEEEILPRHKQFTGEERVMVEREYVAETQTVHWGKRKKGRNIAETQTVHRGKRKKGRNIAETQTVHRGERKKRRKMAGTQI